MNKEQIYLMLIPEYPTKEIASWFQREINDQFGLYRVLPELHITLDSFFTEKANDLKRAIDLIGEICLNYSPFFIYIDGFACFDPPYKSVYLHVKKTEPLVKFYESIHDSLKDEGFSVVEYPEGVCFHITIASISFADRERSVREYYNVCKKLKSIPLKSAFKLKCLELWYPELDPEKRLLNRFSLN